MILPPTQEDPHPDVLARAEGNPQELGAALAHVVRSTVQAIEEEHMEEYNAPPPQRR